MKYYIRKSSPKILATLTIFEKLPKVSTHSIERKLAQSDRPSQDIPSNPVWPDYAKFRNLENICTYISKLSNFVSVLQISLRGPSSGLKVVVQIKCKKNISASSRASVSSCWRLRVIRSNPTRVCIGCSKNKIPPHNFLPESPVNGPLQPSEESRCRS
jgi:hypothetical protein